MGWDAELELRCFDGTSWVVKRDDKDRDTVVLIDGTQWADGRIERSISVDDDLTVEQARQLAAALTAAADEADQMNSYDRIEATQ